MALLEREETKVLVTEDSGSNVPPPHPPQRSGGSGEIPKGLYWLIGIFFTLIIVRSCSWRPDGGEWNYYARRGEWEVVKSYGVTLFWIGTFFIYCACAARLVLSFPLRASWEKLIRISNDKIVVVPVHLLGLVALLANYFPAKVVATFYNERMFCGFLAGVLMAVFKVGLSFAKPSDPERHRHAKPVIRYALTLLVACSLAITVLLTSTLLANVFALRPDNWWDAMQPWKVSRERKEEVEKARTEKQKNYKSPVQDMLERQRRTQEARRKLEELRSRGGKTEEARPTLPPGGASPEIR